MKHKTLVNNWLEAVKKLDFRFPVAKISEDTGYKTATVSEYLGGKKDVSERFIRKFCEVYKLDFETLRKETGETDKPASNTTFHQINPNDLTEEQARDLLGKIDEALGENESAYGTGDINSLKRIMAKYHSWFKAPPVPIEVMDFYRGLTITHTPDMLWANAFSRLDALEEKK